MSLGKEGAQHLYLLDGLQDNGGGVHGEGAPRGRVSAGLEEHQRVVEVVGTLDDAGRLEGSCETAEHHFTPRGRFNSV